MNFWIVWTSACDKGYTGQNCEDVCPFPGYGVDCQSMCNCTETQCDPVNGCKGHSTKFGTIFKRYIEI